MLLLRPDYGETALERAAALLDRARGEAGRARLWTLAAAHQLLHDECAALATQTVVAAAAGVEPASSAEKAGPLSS